MSGIHSVQTGQSALFGSQAELANEEDTSAYSQNTIKHGVASVKPATVSFDSNANGDELSGSLQRIAVELVALEGSTELTLPAVNSHASATFGRVKLTEQVHFSSSKQQQSLAVRAEAGVELALFDATVGLGLALNPKTIGDAAIGLYNTHLDPIADRIAGTDLPALPTLPASWDHTLSLSAELTAGWGIAASAAGELNLNQQGGDITIKALLSPTGVGAIVGAGISIGVD